MNVLLDLLKRHWAGALAGAAPFALALFAVFLTREDTATRLRLEDYQAIASTQEEFNRLLDRFTAVLATTGKPDETIVADLSSNISTLYSKMEAFSPNLGAEGGKKLQAYQSSLAHVKTSLLMVHELADLDPLAVNLAHMYDTQKDLTPVLAKAAGKTAANGS